MNSLIQTFKFLALLYLILSVLTSLFWPLNQILDFIDYLYIPSFFYVAWISYQRKTFFLSLFIVTQLMFLSLLFLEMLSSHGELIYQHFIYLLRWSKYGVILILSLHFYTLLSTNSVKIFVKGLFLTVTCFSALILLDFYGTGEIIQFLFSPKEEALLSNFHEPGVFRLSGTMLNPNDHGVVYVLFTCVFILHQELRNYYYAVLAILLVLLSQSRTAFILVALIFIIWILRLFIVDRNSIQRLAAIALTTVLCFIFLWLSNLTYIQSLFTGEILRSNSVEIRIRGIESATSYTTESKLYGSGVILDQVGTYGQYLDSEIALIFAHYGIFGSILWMLFIVILILLGKKNLQIDFSIWVSFLLLFVGVSFTNLSFSHSQLAVFFFFVLGLSQKKQKINEKN